MTTVIVHDGSVNLRKLVYVFFSFYLESAYVLFEVNGGTLQLDTEQFVRVPSH